MTKSKRFFESNNAFIFSAFLYRFVLEFSYWSFVSPHYSYSGFVWTPDFVKCFESWILYLILVVLAPKKLNKPSDSFVVILLLGLMAPLLSFYGLADQNRYYLYIVLLGYALVCVFRCGRPFRLGYFKEGPLISRAFLVFAVIGVSFWFIVSGGTSHFNLDLTAVYEYREAAGEAINTGLFGYFNIWTFKVFGPTLLTIALWQRFYWLAAFVGMLHVFWFGVSSHKAVLFHPFIVFFVWFWFRRTRALSVVPIVLSGVVLIPTLIFLLSDYYLIASMFVRRALYVIANNTFDYYEFFNSHPQVWWSNSITSIFIDYPYHTNPAELIGEWRGTEAHVNNSFLATGFMHAGVTGVVLYGVLTGLLFRLFDSLATKGIPVWVALAILIIPCRSLLLSADLPTALLSHGIGLAIVLLLFMRRKERTPQFTTTPNPPSSVLMTHQHLSASTGQSVQHSEDKGSVPEINRNEFKIH